MLVILKSLLLGNFCLFSYFQRHKERLSPRGLVPGAEPLKLMTGDDALVSNSGHYFAVVNIFFGVWGEMLGESGGAGKQKRGSRQSDYP